MEPCISTKKFWEQVFLGFQGKNHLFQRKSGYSHFCSSIPCKSDVTLSNGIMHLDEKVLGTSFSWISGKNHLFQRKSGCSDFAQVFFASHVTVV
jgi:hypothetical protein